MLGFNAVLHIYTHELLPSIWNIDHGAGTCTLNSYWCITIVRNHAGYMLYVDSRAEKWMVHSDVTINDA